MGLEAFRRWIVKLHPELVEAKRRYEVATTLLHARIDRNEKTRERCYEALVRKFTPVRNGHKEE